MITSSSQHHEEDEDLDMLRKIAMESLKRGKNDFGPQEQLPPSEHHFHQNMQPIYGVQPELINPEIPFQQGAFQPRPRIPGSQNYMRPRYMNNFPPRHHVRPFVQHRMPPAHQFPPQQHPGMHEFVPIPHVNPQFLANQQQQPPPQIFPNNDFQMEYVPTPAVRLSPRSAEFIAANERAIEKAISKRYSRSPPPRRRRSHSGSPIARRRTRSPRSPYKRRSPNDINRKRYRSKTPENRPYRSRNNSPKAEKRSKSPQNRSQSPRNARPSRRTKDSRYNGNGRYNNNNNNNNSNNSSNINSRKRSASTEEDEKQIKPIEEATKERIEIKEKAKEKADEKREEKIHDEKRVIEKAKSSSSVVEEKSTTPPLTQLPEKREKTQEELEDELLASTDEEEGDQLDINMDDNELDFLEDDSESENEGRFKSKPSTNPKPTTLPTKTSLYSSKYDKGKSSYSTSRSDYKRDDKYSLKRKDHGSRKNSPDLESRKKSPIDRKQKIVNKDKDEIKSSSELERKPMFKSTFKSIDSGEKKAESTVSTKKSESRVTLVRSFVSKPDSIEKKISSTSSSVKSVITANEDSSKTGAKKKIMERLGEFVGMKGKLDGNRSRATKQVYERRNMVKINQIVGNKTMASRTGYWAM